MLTGFDFAMMQSIVNTAIVMEGCMMHVNFLSLVSVVEAAVVEKIVTGLGAGMCHSSCQPKNLTFANRFWYLGLGSPQTSFTA